MTAPAKAPIGEVGRPGNLRPVYNYTPRAGGPQGQGWEPNPSDYNPDLRFPRSVRVYNQMIVDDQVQALVRAITLPIMEAGWDINADGCRPEVEQLVRAELGMPLKGSPQVARRRGQSGIVWQEHLREALECLIYGFAPFEQVYSVTNPGDPGHPDFIPDRPVVHLKKLAQRLPGTVRQIAVAPDGGLLGIRQSSASNLWSGMLDNGGAAVSTDGDVFIDVDRLVFYSFEKKGADWTGTSILRSAYRPWYLKDQLILLDVQGADRQSMGIPVVTYDPSSAVTKEEALEIAANARAGATGGLALPAGCTFQLVGVTGGTVDIGPKIDMHNQAITKAGMAMFIDLGHDRGAYNLGALFVDMFDRGLKAIAAGIGTTATEHVVRDLVEWNFGPDEPYPTIVPGVISAQATLSPADMQMLAAAGLITPDDTLEAEVRRNSNLPEIDKASRKPPPAAPVSPFGRPAPHTPVEPVAPVEKDEPVTATEVDAYAESLMGRLKQLGGRRRARQS